MTIFLDNIIYLLQQSGGISVHWTEYLKRLVESGVDYRIFDYPGSSKNIFYQTLKIPRENSIIDQHRQLYHTTITRYLPEKRLMQAEGIFHSSYYRYAVGAKIKNITTIHDFTYEKYRSGPAKYLHHWQKTQAINHSQAVICVSESTRNDFYSYYPQFPKDRVYVIYNGVDSVFEPLVARAQQQLMNHFPQLQQHIPYIVYVGNRKKYKNFGFVCELLSVLSDMSLVIVGGGALTKGDLIHLEKCRRRYLHLDHVDTVQLNVIYNMAHCLVYSSFYEGFGLPVIEAMAASCPTIVLNNPATHEVCGNASIMIDELSVHKFKDAITALRQNTLRQDLKTKGLQQSQKFSWEQSFKRLLTLYESCE